MNSWIIRPALLIGASVILGLAGVAHAAVEVNPSRVEEHRSIALVKDPVGHQADELKVILLLKGPEAESAVSYEDLRLDQAVDDKGTNLVPAKDPFDDEKKFKKFDNDFFRQDDIERKRKPADPQVAVELSVSNRAATKIAHLRGSLKLVQQGTVKTVEVTGLKPGDSKELKVPTDAGIHITVSVKKGNDVRSIDYNTTGDESALQSVKVLDASGKNVATGTSTWSSGSGPVHHSIDLEKPVDASMKLVAQIVEGRKIVNVPFDLKDIPLP